MIKQNKEKFELPPLEDLQRGKTQVNVTLQNRAYKIVKEYLEKHNVNFSNVIDMYVKDLAKDVEKKIKEETKK